MIRWKFTFDKDEEQEWLNSYCQQGWAMVSFFIVAPGPPPRRSAPPPLE